MDERKNNAVMFIGKPARMHNEKKYFKKKKKKERKEV